MDFSTISVSLQNSLVAHLPMVFGALAILVLGWIAAVTARAAVRKLTGMALP
jgi:hypothetical protein